MQANQLGDPSVPRAATSEYRFRSELTETLTIVVVAETADKAREELARIGLHPSFFELLGRE